HAGPLTQWSGDVRWHRGVTGVGEKSRRRRVASRRSSLGGSVAGITPKFLPPPRRQLQVVMVAGEPLCVGKEGGGRVTARADGATLHNPLASSGDERTSDEVSFCGVGAATRAQGQRASVGEPQFTRWGLLLVLRGLLLLHLLSQLHRASQLASTSGDGGGGGGGVGGS
ncbi:hypothetical protein SK128_002323, partial [Halocaridina rubra]